MQRYAVIEKYVGETPLEAMEKWRATTGLSPDIPLAYAGRLDPMASGKLIVLIGDECKRQKEYHGFDKEYDFEILFGFRTDTGDVLGIPEPASTPPSLTQNEIARTIQSYRGTHTFPYPRFSARTVRGVPMHELTLRGELRDEDIPHYTAQIKRCVFRDVVTLPALELERTIVAKIGTMPPVTDPRKALGADFRRSEIIPRWHELLAHSRAHFTIVRASAVVGSGTYIRTLAEEIGKSLGTSALAYSIHRTNIGTYCPLTGSWGIWTKRF